MRRIESMASLGSSSKQMTESQNFEESPMIRTSSSHLLKLPTKNASSRRIQVKTRGIFCTKLDS